MQAITDYLCLPSRGWLGVWFWNAFWIHLDIWSSLVNAAATEQKEHHLLLLSRSWDFCHKCHRNLLLHVTYCLYSDSTYHTSAGCCGNHVNCIVFWGQLSTWALWLQDAPQLERWVGQYRVFRIKRKHTSSPTIAMQ